MNHALDALRRAERSTRLLPPSQRRTFRVQGWEAIDATVGPDARWMAGIPTDSSRRKPSGPSRLLEATTAASMVRLSKFSREGEVRVRAFYPDTDPPLSVKLIIAHRERQDPILMDVAARTALGGTGHLPVPPLLDSGSNRRYAYLVEPVVFGNHPTTRAEKHTAAQTILPAFLAAHRSAGVTDRPAELHTETMARLERLFAHVHWRRRRWSGVVEVTRQVDELLHADLTVPHGWSHGDLVFSNIIVDDTGAPTVIDWEHAGIDMLAADLVKLFVASFAPLEMTERLDAVATADDIGEKPGRHPLRHQLAVACLRDLSWWEGKLQRATLAGRSRNLELTIARRVDFAIQLLDLGRPTPPVT